MTRKNLLITNNHEDYTGGGSYVMMILNVLKKYYDIYTDKNVGYYHHPRTPWKLQPDEIQLASADQLSLIHI